MTLALPPGTTRGMLRGRRGAGDVYVITVGEAKGKGERAEGNCKLRMAKCEWQIGRMAAPTCHSMSRGRCFFNLPFAFCHSQFAIPLRLFPPGLRFTRRRGRLSPSARRLRLGDGFLGLTVFFRG